MSGVEPVRDKMVQQGFVPEAVLVLASTAAVRTAPNESSTRIHGWMDVRACAAT